MVGHPRHLRVGAGLHVDQVGICPVGQGPVPARNRVPVRVELGITQHMCDAVLECFRDRVLEFLGLHVDLVPAVVQDPVQEQFDEPVVPNDLQRTCPAAVGQAGAVVLLVFDPGRIGLRQLLEHARDRGGRDRELLGQSGGCGPLVIAGQLIDRLQAIVNRLATHF